MTTVETGRCTTVELRSDVAGALEVQRDGAPLAGVDVPARLNANEAVTLRLCEEGHYTARLTAENGAVCDAATDIIREAAQWGPFVSGFFGKQRRVNEEFNSGCDSLVGIEGGYGFYVTEQFEIAPAAGVRIIADDDEDEVLDRASIFAEVEFNYHWSRAMIGGGVGVWDITDDLGRDGSILGQFGVHLTEGSSVRVTWLNQGRIFFDDLDDIGNNYMIWTGLRFQFGLD